MKTFAIVLTSRDNWEVPMINVIQAKFEEEAWVIFAEKNRYTLEELEEMELSGEFSVTIQEVGVELPNIKVYDLPPGYEK
jgi:hypothetical protein